MTHIRKATGHFDSLEALVVELENCGHTKSSLWYTGAVKEGVADVRLPVTIIAADYRMIAQKRTDSCWVTLYGYDDPISASGGDPVGTFNLGEYWLQIITVQ